MAVNLCAAHKKTDSRAAHEVLLACFLQSCSTHRWISCSAQNRARVLYTKDNSHVIREFRLSHSTKIEEHMSVVAREFQLRNELYCMYNTERVICSMEDYCIWHRANADRKTVVACVPSLTHCVVAVFPLQVHVQKVSSINGSQINDNWCDNMIITVH